MRLIYLALILSIAQIFGCTTAPYVRPILPPTAGIPGIYHRIEKGQTLWRISRIYNVDLEEIAKINHILDAANIETGQLIFIPYAQTEKKISAQPYPEDEFIWPAKGKVICGFNQAFNNMINKGINIAPYNNLNVVAARSGRVIFYADNFASFGKTIIIDHQDGFLTVYARNSEIFVKPGDTVQKGSRIAKIGRAGRDKGLYLHFEIRKGYVSQNPLFYLS